MSIKIRDRKEIIDNLISNLNKYPLRENRRKIFKVLYKFKPMTPTSKILLVGALQLRNLFFIKLAFISSRRSIKVLLGKINMDVLLHL